MVKEFMEPIDHVHICDLSCPVEHVMRGAPVVDPEYTLRMTAQAMTIVKAGAVIVCDPHGPTTIVTERDIVHALSDGTDPLRPPSLTPFTQMAEEGTRHVPVRVDNNVVGLVTAEDLFEALNGKLPSLTST